jgi:hypothetical protein
MWCYIAACAAVTCRDKGETLYRDTLCSMPAQVGNITGDPCVTMSPCLIAGNPSPRVFTIKRYEHWGITGLQGPFAIDFQVPRGYCREAFDNIF